MLVFATTLLKDTMSIQDARVLPLNLDTTLLFTGIEHIQTSQRSRALPLYGISLINYRTQHNRSKAVFAKLL